MGLNISGDQNCYRHDIGLERLHHIVKVVDDMLIHSDTFAGHLNDV